MQSMGETQGCGPEADLLLQSSAGASGHLAGLDPHPGLTTHVKYCDHVACGGLRFFCCVFLFCFTITTW